MRKRVIVTGDTSTANSGFAAYKKFLLNGLLESGRFDVAEVGNGGHVEDKAKVPWKYYPTGVKPGDKRYQQYISSPSNEYGAWRWEKICLDFKPTHTVSCDDPWQISHMITSPLKPYYHSLYSPTVDSLPQRVDFLQILSQVDTLLTYTEWAKDYLNSVGLPCLDYIGMGIDPDIMKPLDKKELRRKYNLPEDAIIFGFVGRNQMRKRFPDIVESFARYLKRVPEDIAKRSFLYFHTSHIDQGWNIAESLIEHGVINKVYFTYICQATQKIFCSTFKGERCYSPYSRQLSATAPNVIMSPPLNILNEVYNLFDYYLQPATCEGFGVPVLEAAASNIPLIVTGYSAIKELAEIFNGECVKPGTLNYEHGVMARRASMDIDGWADAMVKYALEKPVVNSREIILQKYTWRHVIDKWVYYIDRADPPKYAWNAPLRQYQVPKLEGHLTATQFVDMLSRDVPQLNWSILNLLTMKNLNNQMELNGKHMHLINAEVVANRYNGIIQNINLCEQIRCGLQTLEKEDFLE